MYDHYNSFRAVSSSGPLIEKALKKKFVIPDFEQFKERIDELYRECLRITDGEVSSSSESQGL